MSDILTSVGASGVATVTMNRGEVHNAFNENMIAELTEAFTRLSADADVRVVLLRGAGKSFSAGADLGWMQRMAGYSHEENLADARLLAAMLAAIDCCAKPTVAVVHGAAFGGGVGLVAACDIAVAAQGASFAFSEVRLGIIPSVISPYAIAAIGERACRRYFLTGERFSAEVGLRLGLLHEVVAAEGLDGAVDAVVAGLLASGPAAQGEAKALVRGVARRLTDAAVLEDTAQRIARVRASAEGREGIGAFLGKRKPGWVP